MLELLLFWFIIAAILGIGEIMMAGTFFLAPFAAGATVAGFAALIGLGPWSFLVFIIVSVVAFLALRPLAKKLELESNPESRGLGANRLRESNGTVIEMIPAGPGEAGMIQIGSETWRAESATGYAIAEGTVVSVTEVMGTRLKVQPTT